MNEQQIIAELHKSLIQARRELTECVGRMADLREEAETVDVVLETRIEDLNDSLGAVLHSVEPFIPNIVRIAA